MYYFTQKQQLLTNKLYRSPLETFKLSDYNTNLYTSEVKQQTQNNNCDFDKK